MTSQPSDSRGCAAIIGVGPGLGLAVARRFGAEGFPVALVARKAERLGAMCEELSTQGITATAFPADCVEESEVRGALEAAAAEFGRVDVLVYNAARLGLHVGPLELTTSAFHRALQVDLVSALVAVQAVAGEMKIRGQGTILLTGGSLGLQPDPQWCALGVGKAGLRNLAGSLAMELEPAGIHVATVTISGSIDDSPEYSSEDLASLYWALHTQPRESWQHELIV
jgi:NAD(P)-dependent dehydrogenase (short-subunit alcohol dehydrogenase family)